MDGIEIVNFYAVLASSLYRATCLFDPFFPYFHSSFLFFSLLFSVRMEKWEERGGAPDCHEDRFLSFFFFFKSEELIILKGGREGREGKWYPTAGN